MFIKVKRTVYRYGIRKKRAELNGLDQEIKQLSDIINGVVKVQKSILSTPVAAVAEKAIKKYILPTVREYYPYNYGRWHLFAVKSRGNALSGDLLKTSILNSFRKQINECNDIEKLNKTVEVIKNSENYKILLTGQGLMTRIFSLKTTSQIALEKMINNKKENLFPISASLN